METIIVKFKFRDSGMFFRMDALDYLDYSEVEYIEVADTGEIIWSV